MDVFEIILGTYESFVIGVKCRFKSQQSKDLELVQSFNDHVHQASIRSVSCSSKYMASSSTDETIEIYNMIRRCHVHTILQHSGTVTSLTFTPDDSHLISTSEDGSIAMFETGTWKLKKLWDKAHKGSAVSFLAVHPSGKLALSVGKDKTLRTWNLVKGRPAYTTNQSSMSAYYFFDNIIWSPAGQYYGLPLNTKLMIFNVETAGIACTIEDNHKIHGITFITENLVCYGSENGSLHCYDIINKKSVWEVKIGDTRVKCLIKVDNRLVSALSDGHISVWELDGSKKPTESCSLFLDCRITCICNNSLRKSKMVKDESDEEVEVKDDTIIGISIPNKTQNIKNKLPINEVQNNKRKLPTNEVQNNKKKLPINGVKKNKLKPIIKKKKSLSNNWEVSDNV